MKIEIQIPDELYARYELQARSRDYAVKRELSERLQAFVEAPPKDRVILLRRHTREAIEKILNCSLLSDEELVDRVTRLAQLSIGEVRLEFSPGQLAEMKRRADKNGRTFEEELKISVKSVQSLVFERL